MQNNNNENIEEKLGDVGEIFCKQEIEGVEIECFLEIHSDGYSQEELESFYTFCRKAPQYILDAYSYLDEQHDKLLGHVYEALFAMEPDLMEEQFPGAGHHIDITPAMTRKRISARSITMRKKGVRPIAIVTLGSNSNEVTLSLSGFFDLNGKFLDLIVDH